METVVTSIGSRTAADIGSLLRARNPLIVIASKEESRIERFLMESAQGAGYDVRFCDSADGITQYDGRAVDSGATDPMQWINAVKGSRTRQLWVMRDLSPWLKDPTVCRALRSLVKQLPNSPRDQARAVVILSPSSDIPAELTERATVVMFPLPDRMEIGALLDAAVNALPPDMQSTAAPNGRRDAAIDAALGLSAEEASSCFAKSLVSTRTIDPATVAQEKKRVIVREKVLEWYDPIPGGLSAVGGLDLLKLWLEERREAFGAAARDYGLPAPKGCLLMGVPGCGKSLSAKAIASAWGMPLLRLDLGAVKSKWVGESESNIRRALQVAETISPCVLWLDELEKALAGASSGAADGGVSSDALGAILTWMQDRAASVFTVATANDISGLPAPLLRAGRFDAVFFVDLPTATERAAILAAALKAHGRDATLSKESLVELASLTVGFSGSELASLVPDALYRSFADGRRAIRATDLQFAASQLVPMSKTAPESITKLREWVKGRARLASTPETADTSGSRRLDI